MTILERRKSEDKYDLTQSPLYKLRSKKKLTSLLNLSSPSELNTILRLVTPYNKFETERKGKKRPVEVPCRI